MSRRMGKLCWLVVAWSFTRVCLGRRGRPYAGLGLCQTNARARAVVIPFQLWVWWASLENMNVVCGRSVCLLFKFVYIAYVRAFLI